MKLSIYPSYVWSEKIHLDRARVLGECHTAWWETCVSRHYDGTTSNEDLVYSYGLLCDPRPKVVIPTNVKPQVV